MDSTNLPGRDADDGTEPHAPPPLIRRTPIVTCPALTGPAGPVRLKLENLQRTGAFKLRGAVRKLARMPVEMRARGVVAASAGNHGLGVALAGQHLGVAITVVVPEGSPTVKRERMLALGADVRVQGADYDAAERHARALARDSGQIFVSPFDDDDIIAGNGSSLAEELHAQVPDLAMVACPIGGGGLISGLALTLVPRGVRVVGVQPAANCAMYDSVQKGQALTEYCGQHTLAEGLEGAVAERTYRIVKERVERIALVSEAAIRRAVAFGYRQIGTILECSGAVALAGFREGAIEPAARGATVCILTGGNIDPQLLDSILAD